MKYRGSPITYKHPKIAHKEELQAPLVAGLVADKQSSI